MIENRVQPEPASMVSPEEARATVADSVLIDNQADYDRIFRGGNLLRHSANRPDAAPENTSPFSAQARPVSKASPPPPPSVSPPPQVEVSMPPIQMPTEQVEEQESFTTFDDHFFFLYFSLERTNKFLLLFPKAIRKSIRFNNNE